MLRINESIRLISKGNSTKQNISGLAVEVGFGNRSSFISSFQKHTGMLPSTFITNYEQVLKDGGNTLEYFDA
jgi:AraC-like DNA-binding protein